MSVTPSASQPLPRRPLDRLHVTPWPDPLVERLGHDPRGAYVERFWLGILGPSSVFFVRHCVTALESAPEGVTLDLGEVAAAIGLGHRGGRNSPLARTILRCCRFGVARAAGETELQVRRRIPPLNRAQVGRLPPALQAAHTAFVDRDTRPGDETDQQRRARRLALGLVECGDGVDDAELQLGRWRFHPAVAADAVRWAWDRHHEAVDPGPEAA